MSSTPVDLTLETRSYNLLENTVRLETALNSIRYVSKPSVARDIAALAIRGRRAALKFRASRSLSWVVRLFRYSVCMDVAPIRFWYASEYSRLMQA
ncbi:hypothetical protein HGRIS_012641 [Hohenbuehelia grisea]|uniref:Uncharacterized protein n=1 Tax=Hohenbuehelia grisea TaxID=104357 RepID=A0ABR3IT15_9AGAR